MSGRTAIVSPLHIKPESLAERLAPLADAAEVGSALHMSNGGPHFDTSGAHPAAASMFAPLDDSFSKVFVIGEFPITYAHAMTLHWLGGMLRDMDGGELFLQILNEKANEARGLLTRDFLERGLAGATVEALQDSWLRITAPGGVDLCPAASILPHLQRGFDEFFEVRNPDAAQRGARERTDAMRSFIYSLFGTSQKAYLMQRILADLGLGGNVHGPIHGLDMGAGYGFMAAELALAGHTMEAVDYNPAHVAVGRWLAARAGLGDRFAMRQGSMEAIEDLQGTYDCISYFGCLLYAQRDLVPGILQAAMQRLRPGGVLILHENPKEGGKPGTLDYEERFEAEELLGLLNANAGDPRFYNSFTGMQVGWDLVKHKLIVAAVRKGGQ